MYECGDTDQPTDRTVKEESTLALYEWREEMCIAFKIRVSVCMAYLVDGSCHVMPSLVFFLFFVLFVSQCATERMAHTVFVY